LEEDITYCVTFLYECPDLWFDLLNEINKASVALHHATRHDEDLGARHWAKKEKRVTLLKVVKKGARNDNFI